MIYNFDTLIDRRSTESVKWGYYEQDVLPMWVADMDFISPEPVIRTLRERVEHGVFGYPMFKDGVREAIVEYAQQKYQWKISPDDVVLLPGVVVGFNLAVKAFNQPGEGVLFQTPVYPPFFYAPQHIKAVAQTTELICKTDGQYEIDFTAFENAITDTTRTFLLCNPHNPVGRVFSKDELQHLAEICLKHDLVICSDEIHCDLVFSGHPHTPIASLDPEIAQNTITLVAPSKTYNIAGLETAAAIIPNKNLRRQYTNAMHGFTPHPNLLGQIAAAVAYREGQEWLDQLLVYLEANRDFLINFVNNELQGIKLGKPEGTYLAWLDCRELDFSRTATPNAQQFFLKYARVAFNDGDTFGAGGQGFVRLNFGCPRSILKESLERIKSSLHELK